MDAGLYAFVNLEFVILDFYPKLDPNICLVFDTMLLSAHINRVSVSRIRFFFNSNFFLYKQIIKLPLAESNTDNNKIVTLIPSQNTQSIIVPLSQSHTGQGITLILVHSHTCNYIIVTLAQRYTGQHIILKLVHIHIGAPGLAKC